MAHIFHRLENVGAQFSGSRLCILLLQPFDFSTAVMNATYPVRGVLRVFSWPQICQPTANVDHARGVLVESVSFSIFESL